MVACMLDLYCWLVVWLQRGMLSNLDPHPWLAACFVDCLPAGCLLRYRSVCMSVWLFGCGLFVCLLNTIASACFDLLGHSVPVVILVAYYYSACIRGGVVANHIYHLSGERPCMG